MRTRSISTATALAVLFSSAALVAGAAGSAAADSSKVVPVASAGDVVADGVHKRVFISDPYSGKIVATDYAGAVVGTLDGLPGVDGLALSADSRELYAAVPGDDSIVSVSTETFTRSARYATGEGTDPEYLAVAGGKVWFGYGGDGHGNIGSLDLTGAEPAVALAQDDETTWTDAPRLAAAPGAPDKLAAAAPYAYWFTLGVYDVGGGTAVRTALAGGPGSGASGMTNDLAFTPDGSRLITANPGDHHRVWQTSDLAEVGAYATEHHPGAVAVAPDGTVAAGTESWYEPDVHVFTPGATTPVRQYDFPGTGGTSGGDTLADGGLVWEPGGSRLFAVTSNSRGEYALRVLSEPVKSVVSMTVTAPETATRAKPLTVSGRLTATLPLPAGTPVTVTRTDLESPKGKSLGTKKLGDKGAFSFKDTPPAGGKVTYKVAYAGDAAHTAASGSAKVAVSRAKPALSVNRNGDLFSYGADVKFTAHLGKTHTNRTVEIYADPFGSDKPRKLVKKGKVNSKGDLAVVVDMKRDTKVTAVFAGDARYASRSVASTAYAKAKVSLAVSKHYKTGTIGSKKYYYFHKNTDPILTTTMNYYKGRAQRLQYEVYYGGTWYEGESFYFTLGTEGVSVVRFEAPGESGIRVRIRSSYINSGSGDNVNSTTHGAWKYIYWAK